MHPAADPLVRVVGLAESLHFPRRPDPLAGGVQPQRHQDLRVDGGAPRMLSPSRYHLFELGQIQSLNKPPNGAGRMVLGQERIEVRGHQPDLMALGTDQPRFSRRGRRHVGLGLRLLVLRDLAKQVVRVHAPPPSTCSALL